MGAEFLTHSGRCLDLYSVMKGHKLQALKKTAVYLDLFVQVSRDGLVTNNTLFGVVYSFDISPQGVTSDNLTQLRGTWLCLDTA